MASPFDYVKAVNEKNYIFDKEIEDKSYNSYIMNSALSYYRDTIFFANEANKFQNVNNKQHFDFYYFGIPKRKRWSPWVKTPKFDKEFVDKVANLYKVSFVQAKEYINIMDESDLNMLKSMLTTSSEGEHE